MGKLFTDLSYNKKVLQPIGRPVDDLKALYKDKQDDYNYVVDSLHQTETVLNQIPSHSKDQGILQTAKDKYTSTFAELSAEGDFENKLIDTKNLANDLTNRYGLMDVQRVAKEQSAYLGGLKERLDKGDITRQQYENASRDSERNYQGLQKDEVTGAYLGTYGGTQVQNYVNASASVMDALKGWKENKIVLRGKDGKGLNFGELTPAIDANGVQSGYYKTGTKEFVSEAELVDAARAHVQSSPDIQSQFEEDTYFEMQNLLSDANGNRREVTVNDIRGLINNSNTKAAAAQLGINGIEDLNNLDEVLDGKDLEAVYKHLKKDQLVSDAIKLGVSKESYEKYEASYLKDWKQEFKLKHQDEFLTKQYEILHTYDNEVNFTSKDIATTAAALEAGKDNLVFLKASLSKAEDTEDANEVAKLQTQIDKQKFFIHDVEEQRALIFENFDMDKLFKDYAGIDRAIGSKLTDISNDNLKSLIYAKMNNSLTDAEVEETIQDMETFEEWQGRTEPERQQELEDIAERRSQLDLGDQHRMIDPTHNLDKEYQEYKDKKIQVANARISHATNAFKDQLDNSDVEYVKRYQTLLYSKMTPKQRAEHPMASNVDIVENIYETDPNFYQGMSSVSTNVDIKTQIEQDYLDGDSSEDSGAIKWDTATVLPTLDYRADRTGGRYRPALTMQVDVVIDKSGKDGKPVMQRVNMPVFYDNPNYEKRFEENLGTFRDKYVNLSKQRNLTPSEQEILDRTNLNLYNNTQFATDIDLKNLHTLPDKSDTTVKVNETTEFNIRSYKNSSPTGMSFYITEGKGDNIQFLGFDNAGSVVRLSEADMRSDETVDSIRKGKLSMLGGNTVTALKTQFGDMTFAMKDAQKQGNINPVTIEQEDLKLLTNDPSIRLADTTFEQPYIHKDVYDDAVALFDEYSNIVATGLSRNESTDVAGSAIDSKHKINNGAKAMDIRANDNSPASQEAKKIHALTDREKRRRGIEKTIQHGEGSNLHVHIQFI